jgi:cytolysin (calcineurin-like family phosphatase)
MELQRRVFRAMLATMAVLPGWTNAAPMADARPKPNRDVTFISTSDCHFAALKNEDRNERNLDTVRGMNSITDICWPEALGGDRVKAPRGVVVLGDVIDDGDSKVGEINVSERQYAKFLEYFGLDGKEGLLKYPCFECWGNHDGPPIGKDKNGFSFQSHLKERNAVRKQKGLISNVSESGLQYSWDWDDVHFVNLGIYAADKQREGVRYSPVWHDPQGALKFLKDDLSQKVGSSGRPVVLMSHMGFDTDWWTPDDWADLYAAAKQYNVIAYLYGHSGTGVRGWAPAGEKKQWLCINEGQTENGFFVVQVIGDRVRFAYRAKNWDAAKKNPAEPKGRGLWNGEWKWDWTQSATLGGTMEGKRR